MRQSPVITRIIKIVSIALFGALIPNISGLVHNSRNGLASMAGTYAYFIVTALLVWEGNSLLMRMFRKRKDGYFKKYYPALILLTLAEIIFSGVLSFCMFYLWEIWAEVTVWTPESMARATGLIIVTAIFISNMCEIVSLNNEKEYNLSRVGQLSILKAHAELEALKNQIDPHFIFNSLNTLSFLIIKDPRSAKLFNDTLAKVYRYILSSKDKDLVMLKDEVEFIFNYFYLMKIRFSDAISLELEINDLSSDEFLIPPISLQALVENAIKHNEFSSQAPLGIYISVSSDHILVRNAVHPKAYLPPGQRSGLINLGHRFQLITKRTVTVENKNNVFSVRLPILKF